MDFDSLWDSPRTKVVGWCVLGDGDDNSLAELRLAMDRTGWFKTYLSLLLKVYREPPVNQKLDVETANLMLSIGFVRYDIGEVDELGHGVAVAVVADTNTVAGFKPNGLHASAILDRIEAGELYPSEELIRCLLLIPSAATRLSGIDFDALREIIGVDRIPSEQERLARIEPITRTVSDVRRMFDIGDEGLRLLPEGQEGEAREKLDEVRHSVERFKADWNTDEPPIT